jgi:hypothetical protein
MSKFWSVSGITDRHIIRHLSGWPSGGPPRVAERGNPNRGKPK